MRSAFEFHEVEIQDTQFYDDKARDDRESKMQYATALLLTFSSQKNLVKLQKSLFQQKFWKQVV